jgi:hypothetical protein
MTNDSEGKKPFVLSVPEGEIPDWMRQKSSDWKPIDLRSYPVRADASPLGDLLPSWRPRNAQFKLRLVDRSERESDVANSDERVFFFEGLIRDQNLRQYLQEFVTVVFSPYPLLIEGETGTGKELLARSVHNSCALKGKFITVDCGNIPTHRIALELFGGAEKSDTPASEKRKGLVEDAEGGTLFLDRIENIDSELQAKLQRFLPTGSYIRAGETEERHVIVRVIASATKSIETLVKGGLFRPDLAFVFARGNRPLPTLVQQADAIWPVFNDFVGQCSREIGKLIEVHPGTQPALLLHDWHGNFDELRYVAQVAAARAAQADGVIDFHLVRAIIKRPLNGDAGKNNSVPCGVDESMIWYLGNEVRYGPHVLGKCDTEHFESGYHDFRTQITNWRPFEEFIANVAEVILSARDEKKEIHGDILVRLGDIEFTLSDDNLSRRLEKKFDPIVSYLIGRRIILAVASPHTDRTKLAKYLGFGTKVGSSNGYLSSCWMRANAFNKPWNSERNKQIEGELAWLEKYRRRDE